MQSKGLNQLKGFNKKYVYCGNYIVSGKEKLIISRVFMRSEGTMTFEKMVSNKHIRFWETILSLPLFAHIEICFFFNKKM